MTAGNVYMFNIWQSDITKITLNGTQLPSGAITAPSATSKPPYVPNQAVAPKTNLTASQDPGAAFMCGTENPNEVEISFDGEVWQIKDGVYIPGQDDKDHSMPYDRDVFIYIAHKQLYVFDNNGVNIPQPPADGPFAAADENVRKPPEEAPFAVAE